MEPHPFVKVRFTSPASAMDARRAVANEMAYCSFIAIGSQKRGRVEGNERFLDGTEMFESNICKCS